MRNSLKSYCETKGYDMVSRVRANVNGYKYVTLIDSQNPGEPENLYLGQRYSETVEVNDSLPIGELFVSETLNAAGETRLKLTDKRGDARATLEAMGYTSF